MLDRALDLPAADQATERPISVAITAMGGQGGGVLTGWITALAENAGWIAQATSVPGVAQRTGATVYYVEMMRPSASGARPVLAQMPTPGDVDLVLAAEYMEAGRSVLRGLITPDRTTLIASDHRALATVEKIAPGHAIADSSAVTEALGVAAKREITFDMQALAVSHGSVISAALFGALAASGALPFPRAAFEAVIAASPKGAEASRRAFDAAFARAQGDAPAPGPEAQPTTVPLAPGDPQAMELLAQLRRYLPAEAHGMAEAGLRKVVDFQDGAYGRAYLDRLRALAAQDQAERGYAFTVAAAKHLANAMAYDDVIRVADLKTRASRRDRVAAEIGLTEGQILTTTEYMHPRLEEVASTLPVGWATWLLARPRLCQWLDRRINKGRRVATYSLRGFLMLYGVAGLKRWRRRSLRHARETAHWEAWLAQAEAALPSNYDLAVEILGVRRLVKGYSDTHARGLSKFDRVMGATQTIAARADAAAWTRRLITAALADPEGTALDGAIQTIETL